MLGKEAAGPGQGRLHGACPCQGLAQGAGRSPEFGTTDTLVGLPAPLLSGRGAFGWSLGFSEPRFPLHKMKSVVRTCRTVCRTPIACAVRRTRLRGLDAGEAAYPGLLRGSSGVEAGAWGPELTADSLRGSPRDDVIYSVRVGSPWINQTTQTSSDAPVRRVIVNSKFQSRRYWSWVGKANNIGLLQLEQSLKYSEYVWPICLPGFDYELNDHSICTVMGWGLPRVDGELGPP